jgi:RF-1 domain
MQLLFSVTKKDFEMQTFTVPGPGGGGKDTSKTGVRLIHKDSGAVGEGRETRSVTKNREAAFKRLVNTKKFKDWHRIECARRMGKPIPETPEQIKERVDRMIDEGLKNGTIKVEYLEDGAV